MRIGFVSTLAPGAWGGSEALWTQTAARLREMGVEVACHAGGWEHLPDPIARLEQLGCQMTYLSQETVVARPAPSFTARVVNRVQRALGRQTVPPHFTGGNETYSRWLETAQPDLVVISQGYHLEGIPVKSVCLEKGVAYAPIVHSAGDCGWPGDPLAEALAMTYERAARAYFVSQGVLNYTRRILAVPLPDARIVRNPYNVIAPEPLPWPESDVPLRLACLARLECIQKGQDLLLEALRAPKWRERAIEITLYGDGPNRGRLQALIEMYGLSNVRIAGFDPDVTGIWKRTHALVLPSRYEGLPMVVVEAMLCGRPCIVTDVMGSAELLEDDVTGFIAAAAKPSLIEEALERAYQNRHRWEEMGRQAAVAVRERIPADPIGVFAEELVELAELAGRAEGSGGQ